jgi:hypothetical protein
MNDFKKFVDDAGQADAIRHSVLRPGSVKAEHLDARARSVQWDGIEGKPSVFPPSVHSHVASDITGSGGKHLRVDIQDFWKPPFWVQIPDKPSVFPPSEHDHGVHTGLLDDDHTQYVMAGGRAGGQTIYGGLETGSLSLATNHGQTKGSIGLGVASSYNDQLNSLLINCSALGSNAVGCIGLGGSIAPTTSPSNRIQFYSIDYNAVADKQCLHIRNEDGVIVRLNQDVSTLAGPTFDHLHLSGNITIPQSTQFLIFDPILQTGIAITATNDGASENILLYANNVLGLGINYLGNVGVGYANPLSSLDVRGTYSGLPATSGTTNNATLRFGYISDAWAGVALDMGFNTNSPYQTWIQSRNPTDYSVNRPLLLNPNGGYVGVGVPVPASRLHIKTAPTLDGLTIESASNTNYWNIGSVFAQTNSDLFIGFNTRAWNASYVTISASGLVGIGITNPAHPLTIQAAAGSNALGIIGRSDHYGFIQFFKNDGTTLEGAIYGITNKMVFTDAAAATTLTITGGKVQVESLKVAQSHPANYKAVYVDTDTGELYRIA